MSWGWVAAAFDILPGDLPPAERTVVLALAENARRGSRRASPGLPKLLARSGLKSRSQLAAVLGRLAGRGLIRQVERARRGHVAVYELLFDEVRFDVDTEMGPVDRTQPPAEQPTAVAVASASPDATHQEPAGIGFGTPDADTEVTDELRPAGPRIASGGPDPSLASSLEVQAAAAEPTDDEPGSDLQGGSKIASSVHGEHQATEELSGAVEVNPYADLAGRLAHDEQLPASWQPDIAAALARGCTPEQITAAYQAPVTGTVRSSIAVRRRRIRDLHPEPATLATSAPSVFVPPNLHQMCRRHTQPAPCPVCADLEADDGGAPATPARVALQTRADGVLAAHARPLSTLDGIAELRARLPRPHQRTVNHRTP
ncbi:hypothetical protein FF36_01912 [Frankia torreyi]|uniref:Helix-turn-helix domain n=1 Tax=Frankia torreyi TaxID=1856 RepID=A0A0D8BK14_9ACTN|nr:MULTISPECIES: hypothetical protein [Frankia]KJE23727.1 hypothetical protein FF36_01912 [Frankia torreyi]